MKRQDKLGSYSILRKILIEPKSSIYPRIIYFLTFKIIMIILKNDETYIFTFNFSLLRFRIIFLFYNMSRLQKNYSIDENYPNPDEIFEYLR